MKYSVATIPCNGPEDWQIDVLTQELADLGFDSFEQDGDTLRAYISTDLLPTINCQLSTINCQLSLDSCPDENWNAVWEASHEVEQLPLGIRIVPHCAFGAGHHETTSMMIGELMGTDLKGKKVFDHGTGTGVLAIFAKRLGANYVLADDIDENSVRNAGENAELNGVDIDVRLTVADLDLAASNFQHSPFDLILANIHRNILLRQMPAYSQLLAAGGELWLSGFYESDIPALVSAAEAQGLHHLATRRNGDWRLLRFGK